MKSKAGIYFLIDPLADMIRYVGQSTNLARRKKDYEHCYKGNVGNGVSSAVREWLWELKRTGYAFEFRVVCSVEHEVLNTAATFAWLDTKERELITELQPFLLNKTAGGTRCLTKANTSLTIRSVHSTRPHPHGVNESC